MGLPKPMSFAESRDAYAAADAEFRNQMMGAGFSSSAVDMLLDDIHRGAATCASLFGLAGHYFAARMAIAGTPTPVDTTA